MGVEGEDSPPITLQFVREMGYCPAPLFRRAKLCALTALPQLVHAHVKVAGKQLCSHCRRTTTAYMCKACNVPLHIKCFGLVHEV